MIDVHYPNHSPAEYDAAMQGVDLAFVFGMRATAAGVITPNEYVETPSPAGKLSVSNPLVVDEVARRHPDLTQIIAHLGHPWQRETIVALRKNRRVFADVSASWARPLDGDPRQALGV